MEIAFKTWHLVFVSTNIFITLIKIECRDDYKNNNFIAPNALILFGKSFCSFSF